MSKIEWTDKTINPLGHGCFGPGGTPEKPQICSYCYARRMAIRGLRGCSLCKAFIPHWHPEELNKVFHWKKPRRIFVQSMGDLFGGWVPNSWVIQVLTVVKENPHHTFQFLTKNPQALTLYNPWPSNCWVGTTVTNQADADERIPWLLQADAPVRFVSHEPLLGGVDVGRPIRMSRLPDIPTQARMIKRGNGIINNVAYLDWAIIGAMTGPGAVKLEVDWVMNLAQQYKDAGVPLFLKDNLGFKDQPQEFPA